MNLRQTSRKTAKPPAPPRQRQATLQQSLSSGFLLLASLRRPQIRLQLDLQLDLATLLSRKLQVVNNEEDLVAFQRVDETHQGQVVSGDVGLDFDQLQVIDSRVFLRVLFAGYLHS